MRDSGRPSTRRSAPDGPTPLEILERRYARGELSEEEFERMRGKLEDGA